MPSSTAGPQCLLQHHARPLKLAMSVLSCSPGVLPSGAANAGPAGVADLSAGAEFSWIPGSVSHRCEAGSAAGICGSGPRSCRAVRRGRSGPRRGRAPRCVRAGAWLASGFAACQVQEAILSRCRAREGVLRGREERPGGRHLDQPFQQRAGQHREALVDSFIETDCA
jgi:hypothetical protein